EGWGGGGGGRGGGAGGGGERSPGRGRQGSPAGEPRFLNRARRMRLAVSTAHMKIAPMIHTPARSVVQRTPRAATATVPPIDEPDTTSPDASVMPDETAEPTLTQFGSGSSRRNSFSNGIISALTIAAASIAWRVAADRCRAAAAAASPSATAMAPLTSAASTNVIAIHPFSPQRSFRRSDRTVRPTASRLRRRA